MKDRLLQFAGSALALALLLPNHYPPWATFHADCLAGVAFAPLMLWALWQSRSVPFLALGAGFLSVVPLVQILTGQINFAGDGWMAWLYVTSFALAVWSGASYVSMSPGGIGNIAPLLSGVIVAALVSVGIAIHQWLDLQLLGLFIVDLKHGDRPYANLAQPNQLATLLMLAFAGVAFLYENRKLRAWIALAAAAILAFGLAMTQSRTPLLAMCFVLPAYLVMRKRVALRLTPLALVLTIVIFVLTVSAWSTLNQVLLLPHAPTLAERSGENLRLILWQQMVAAATRSPWIGYGWNQVALAQQATALDFPATYWFFDSSHNLFLDIALWSGIPVALGVAFGLLVWLARQIVGCCDPLSWCALLAVVVVFCHAMVEYPLSYAYFLLPVGFLMGALSEANARKSLPLLSIPRPILSMVTLAALGVFIAVVSDYIPLEEQWRNIRYEQARIGTTQIELPPDTLILTQLSEHARFAQTRLTSKMTSEQLDWMRRVSERYAWAASTFKYAHAAALNQHYDAASTALAKLCKVQSRRMCSKSLDEWKSLAEKDSNLRLVILPGEMAN